MNRVTFAASSGVVMDQSKAHGAWLDNGELIHLTEWRRAGGQLLAERRRKEEKEESFGVPEKLGPYLPVDVEPDLLGNGLSDLFDTAMRLIGKIFK